MHQEFGINFDREEGGAARLPGQEARVVLDRQLLAESANP